MMRMIALTFISCLFCASLTAPPLPPYCIIETPEAIRPYEAIWNATCAVESNFNPMAIGDKHLKKKSYGIVQVRQARLDDFNHQNNTGYTVKDMLDPIKAKHVFMFYANQHPPDDIESISREWNGGPDGMKKKSTYKYYQKIKNAL